MMIALNFLHARGTTSSLKVDQGGQWAGGTWVMEALVIRGARPLEDPRCTWVMGARLARVRSKNLWANETGGV